MPLKYEEGQGDTPFPKTGPHAYSTFYVERAMTPVRATYRQHSHCPDCWGEASFIDDKGVERCPTCEAKPSMIVCTPIVCASS